jgi:hypothetical protein
MIFLFHALSSLILSHLIRFAQFSSRSFLELGMISFPATTTANALF